MPRGFAAHPSLLAGVSFIPWIKDGRLVTLEGFTNEGYWPMTRQSSVWPSNKRLERTGCAGRSAPIR
jgi:hypothetical protein